MDVVVVVVGEKQSGRNRETRMPAGAWAVDAI